MSGRGEETHSEDQERPRPVRFSIFGQIQQQQQQLARARDSYSELHPLTIKAEGGDYRRDMDDRYHHDDGDDEGDDHDGGSEVEGDQPLDFSAKPKTEPHITAKVAVHGYPVQPWSHLPATGSTSHSSESGVSDLCSNSPQSDGEPSNMPPAKSPELGGRSPVHSSLQQTSSHQKMSPQVPSPIPAALSAIYGPLAALQNGRAHPVAGLGIDPAITAATTQLLTNLAAVTNGGKGGKNTRPFKAYPRDPMSLPLGLYGLPIAGNNVGEETVMTQASNDAYAEFRRQMLSQVNATKSKRKNSNSQSNSVNGDDDLDTHGHNDNGHGDLAEATHIRGTVSVTDLRLMTSANEDDSEHSANDSVQHAPIRSPNHSHQASGLGGGVFNGDLSLGSSPMVPINSGTPSSGGGASSGGGGGGSTRKRGRNGEEIKDEAYWERRRKNNEAAKRSRDARRAKEDEIAIRAAFLEQENLKLRFELANLKNETAKLRCMIYNS